MTDSPADTENTWHIFRGTGEPHELIDKLPEAPPWRRYQGVPIEREPAPATVRTQFVIEPHELDLINAALFLRRPLLVTGKPGTGKTTLARAVAHELQLGEVLKWDINTRSTLHEGLYRYDAIGRLHDNNLDKDRDELGAADTEQNPEHTGNVDPQSSPAKLDSSPPESTPDSRAGDIGRYIRLGPLGTALLPSKRPRVLLVDEIDKSDIDLPNDLLHVFEEGHFEIPELTRLNLGDQPVAVFPDDGDERVKIVGGHVWCHAFPFVVLTSNGERDFPPPFLRRCIRLKIEPPDTKKLTRIVLSHFRQPAGVGEPLTEKQLEGEALTESEDRWIKEFVKLREKKDLATDQLLNALYLRTSVSDFRTEKRKQLRDALFEALR